MTHRFYLLGTLSFLGFAAALNADVCGTRQYLPLQTQYQAPALTIPLYGASLGAETDPEVVRALNVLIEEIRGLKAELAASRPAAAPRKLAAPTDGPALAVAHCATCHTAGRLAKGTEFTMFSPDGKPLLLNRPDRDVIVARLEKGTMPPPTRLKPTEAEYAGLKGFYKTPPAPTVPAKK